MSFILSVLLLLLLARLAGEVVEQYGQPAMLGEIAAGVLLGPSVLQLFQITPEIHTLAELGVLLLVFHAGMEMDPTTLGHAFRGRRAWVPILGFIIPLVIGLATGLLLGFSEPRVIFLSLCIAITALPVSIRILMDLGILRTGVGELITSTAVTNDILALLALGPILEVETGATTSWLELIGVVFWSLLKTGAFLGGVVITARLVRHSTGRLPVSRYLLGSLLQRLRSKEALFAVVLLFVLGFAALADLVGMHFVIGAFFGSMLITHEIVGRVNFEALQRTTSSITMGFLAPIFFATIGLEFDLEALSEWVPVLAILVAAFLSKIMGGFLGARLAGLDRWASLAVGSGLNARGVMELVIANIALGHGLIDHQLFSILVLMGAATTLSTPLLLALIDRMRSIKTMGVEGPARPVAPEASASPAVADHPVINDPPVPQPDRLQVRSGSALTVSTADLARNDVDPEGDALTVTGVILGPDTHGTVSFRNDLITYEPEAGFEGRAVFQYCIQDRHGQSAVGRIDVEVQPVTPGTYGSTA